MLALDGAAARRRILDTFARTVPEIPGSVRDLYQRQRRAAFPLGRGSDAAARRIWTAYLRRDYRGARCWPAPSEAAAALRDDLRRPRHPSFRYSVGIRRTAPGQSAASPTGALSAGFGTARLKLGGHHPRQGRCLPPAPQAQDAQKKAGAQIRSLSDLTVGDYVVHVRPRHRRVRGHHQAGHPRGGQGLHQDPVRRHRHAVMCR